MPRPLKLKMNDARITIDEPRRGVQTGKHEICLRVCTGERRVSVFAESNYQPFGVIGQREQPSLS